MASVIVYFRDYGGEVVSTGIPVQPIATAPEKQAVVDQLQLWSRGENDGADEQVQLEARIGNGANSPEAISSVYAYMVFKDNVNGRNYKERLPMPDLGKAVDAGGELAWFPEQDASGNTINVANPLHADYATLKAALEAAYISPNGNTAQLIRVYVPNKL